MIGIVLAAGFGRRMGGRKARLVVGGEHLLSAHIRRMVLAGCEDVIAVVRAGDERLAPHVVVSPADDQVCSLRYAMADVPESTDFVVITLVDVAPASVDTIERLVSELELPDVDAATPSFRGVGGHPIVIRRSALDALSRHDSLHSLLLELGPRRRRVEVADRAVITDFDSPGDVVAYTGERPTFVR